MVSHHVRPRLCSLKSTTVPPPAAMLVGLKAHNGLADLINRLMVTSGMPRSIHALPFRVVGTGSAGWPSVARKARYAWCARADFGPRARHGAQRARSGGSCGCNTHINLLCLINELMNVGNGGTNPRLPDKQCFFHSLELYIFGIKAACKN